MIPNYEPQLRPTYPQATTNPNYDQLRQKQTHPKNVAIATNYPTTNPNYDQLRPLRRLATTTAPPPKGGASRSWDGSSRCRKTDQSQTTKNRPPRKEESNTKKPLVTQTITACPGQTGHPKSKITTATHTGQGQHLRGITHVQATPAPTSGLRGNTHAVPDRASPQASRLHLWRPNT